MNKTAYEKKSAALYDYKKEQTLNAAIEYAAACSRCGAEWDRLTIVQFCANTCQELTARDALDIAQCVRGMYI